MPPLGRRQPPWCPEAVGVLDLQPRPGMLRFGEIEHPGDEADGFAGIGEPPVGKSHLEEIRSGIPEGLDHLGRDGCRFGLGRA